jgi:hypothetical protein
MKGQLMSMGKRRRVGGAEEDAFCKWCRRYLIMNNRSEIKTNVRRRERHEAKRKLAGFRKDDYC